MTDLIIDLFGGAGGFAAGAHQAAPDADIISFELDQDACDTQDANGMQFVQLDLSTPPPRDWTSYDLTATNGRYHLHASPPCQSFSMAGKGDGRKHLDTLKRAIENIFIHGEASTNDDEAAALAEVPEGSLLTLVPAWWIRMSKPDSISMEQVRAVLPLWETYARCLTILGYKAWAGYLHAEQYGVPQARQRAWLIADKSLSSIVVPPKPTHSKYHNRKPEHLDEGVLPWVSMAEALGWGGAAVGFPRRNDTADGGTYRSRDLFPSDRPSGTVTEKARSWHWYVMQGGVSGEGKPRRDDQPAPTISAKGTASVTADPDSHYGTERSKANDAGESWEHLAGSRKKARRLTVEEAATLQGFPEGFTFAGSKTSQFRQIGNAVNPPVARAILKGLGW